MDGGSGNGRNDSSSLVLIGVFVHPTHEVRKRKRMLPDRALCRWDFIIEYRQGFCTSIRSFPLGPKGGPKEIEGASIFSHLDAPDGVRLRGRSGTS